MAHHLQLNMLKRLIIASFLLSFIGCDDSSDRPVEKPAVKPLLTKDKPSTQANQAKKDNSIQPLNLRITPEMMEAIIDTDETPLKQVSEKPGLFDTMQVKKQDKINTSFKVYFDENETDYLNPEAIEGGKIDIEITH